MLRPIACAGGATGEVRLCPDALRCNGVRDSEEQTGELFYWYAERDEKYFCFYGTQAQAEKEFSPPLITQLFAVNRLHVLVPADIYGPDFEDVMAGAQPTDLFAGVEVSCDDVEEAAGTHLISLNCFTTTKRPPLLAARGIAMLTKPMRPPTPSPKRRSTNYCER